MAKLPQKQTPQPKVLLALKSELWQSLLISRLISMAVLLALKSELWQSMLTLIAVVIPVLLALKSELWQSRSL